MASFLQRHRAENTLYAAAGGFGLLGVVDFVISYFRTDWAKHFPVLPFFLVLAAGSFTLAAVTISLLRLFHQDHYPDAGSSADPLGPSSPATHGSSVASRHPARPDQHLR